MALCSRSAGALGTRVQVHAHRGLSATCISATIRRQEDQKDVTVPLHVPDHNYVSRMLEEGSGASPGRRHQLSAADPCMLGQEEIKEPSLLSLAWHGH